jgi:hypothetical protein
LRADAVRDASARKVPTTPLLAEFLRNGHLK